MNRHNLGRFTLPAIMVDNRPEEVAQVFALLKCVPIRCENMAYNRSFDYMAISERFDEIKPGMEIPWYQLEITANDGQVESVEVVPLP